MNSEHIYRKFAGYYDSYTKGFRKDLELYRSFCHKSDNILEVGCGTGRVLENLMNAGYKVTGVDISEEMLDIARQKLSFFLKSGTLRLKKHSLADRPLPELFNKVLITFYTFNYVLDRPEAFLKNTYLSMANGGSILIDMFYPKTRVNPDMENVWTSHSLVHKNKTIEYKDKRRLLGDVEERIQIFIENGKETRIKTLRKYHSKNAIKTMLENCGFSNIRVFNTYSADGFVNIGEDTPVPKHNFLVRATKY